MLKKQIKYLKRLPKSTPVKSLTKIIILPPKTNPPRSACLHCINVNDISETWREKVEFEEPIYLYQRMYLLVKFMYSQFKVYNQYYLLLYKCLQLIKSKSAILALCVKQLWNAKVDHLCLFKVVWNNQKWFKKDYCFWLIWQRWRHMARLDVLVL